MLQHVLSYFVPWRWTGVLAGFALLSGQVAQAAPSSVTVLRNANGYTLLAPQSSKSANTDLALQRFSSLAFDAQGKIIAIGNHEQVKLALGVQHASAKVIDVAGKTLIPGLIDAHGHVFGLGEESSALQLRDTKSLPQALQSIAQYAKQHANEKWVVGGGWNQAVWKLGRFPIATELDQAVPDKPAWLVRVDGHAGWANSRALQLAGINEHSVDPVGGKIERDANGKPTGILIDKAMGLLDKILPATSEAQMRAWLELSLREMASLGLTSVHDAGVGVKQDQLYREYARNGKLSTRIFGMIRGTENEFDQLQSMPRSIGEDIYQLRAVKLFADGALGSRGAALLAPYADMAGSAGLLFQSDAQLQAKMKKAMLAGYQVNVHAIGDLANRQVMQAHQVLQQEFEQNSAQKSGGMPASAMRHRIEHAQVIALEDIPRLASLQLIASMQPTHATSDMNMAQNRVGAERILGAYAWRRVRLAGGRIACGSDFPVESANPMWGIHAAVTRQDKQGQPLGGWYANEAMSVKEALACFTLDAAYAAQQENSIGSLEVGKWADFVILDRDLFTISPYDIHAIKVLQTWMAGKQVFAKE